MQSKVGNEFTYLFPNFNGCTNVVWEWIGDNDGHNYLSMRGATFFQSVNELLDKMAAILCYVFPICKRLMFEKNSIEICPCLLNWP